MEPFDLEAVYDEKIAPLMTQIIAICNEHQMPMLATFLYSKPDEPNCYDFCTTCLAFEGRIPPHFPFIVDHVLHVP